MADSIDELTGQLEAFAAARNWHQYHAPKNLAAALIVEAGELLEHFQWMSEQQSRELSESQRQEVASEIADVLLYLVQLSTALNIDPLQAARDKMARNEVRFPPAGQVE